MKNSDIAMVILIAAVSVVVSYFLGNAILGDPNDKVENLDYMVKISGSVDDPDGETFNPVAKNPTVEVYVGNCGALEEWSDVEKVCKLRPEFGGETEEEKKGEDKEENNADADANADADTDTDAEADAGQVNTDTDNSSRSTGVR